VGDAPAPPPPPVAIRITRPYATEDEYLDRELETLSRASITLLGAQSRPQGVVLRFELALTSGVVLMRGEGRVVGFKTNAFEGLGGLTLRFTRLDTRSKALVDKATALREQRRPSTRPPLAADAVDAGGQSHGVQLPEPPRESAPVIPALSEPMLPIPLPTPTAEATPLPEATRSTGATLFVEAAPADAAPLAPSVQAQEGDGGRAPAPASVPPAGRDSLLERLRTRARSLGRDDVERILEPRRRA
jgi:hypothetical protein